MITLKLQQMLTCRCTNTIQLKKGMTEHSSINLFTFHHKSWNHKSTNPCSLKLKLHPTPHSWVVTLRAWILNYFLVLKWTHDTKLREKPEDSKTRKMLTHRLRKYLSTFKKGFLDDTSYVGRFTPGLSNCSVFSSKIHVHDPISEILIDWQHTTSLRRPKETLSYYCYTHTSFSPFLIRQARSGFVFLVRCKENTMC